MQKRKLGDTSLSDTKRSLTHTILGTCTSRDALNRKRLAQNGISNLGGSTVWKCSQFLLKSIWELVQQVQCLDLTRNVSSVAMDLSISTFQPPSAIPSNWLQGTVNYHELCKSKSLHLHDSKLNENSPTSFLRYTPGLQQYLLISFISFNSCTLYTANSLVRIWAQMNFSTAGDNNTYFCCILHLHTSKAVCIT